MSFDTFPIPNAEGMIDEINSRLLQQDALAGEVAGALGQTVISRLGYQDSLQSKVAGKLSRTANAQISSQQSIVDGIQSKLQTAGASPPMGLGGPRAAVAPATFFSATAQASSIPVHIHIINPSCPWYCQILAPGATPGNITGTQEIWQTCHPQTDIPGYDSTVVVGPFTTQAEAIACGTPTLPPPPPPPTPTLWFVCCVGESMTMLPADKLGNHPCIAGPFTSTEDAEAWMSAHIGACKKPSPLPPPSGGTVPVSPPSGNGQPLTPPEGGAIAPISCGDPWPVPPALQKGLPVIGSPEWCAFEGDIIVYFAAVGHQIRLLLLDFTDPQKLQAKLDDLSGQLNILNPLDFPKGAALWLVSELIDLASPAICWVHNAIGWVDSVLTQSLRCDPATYGGLCLLRAALSILQRMRLGTDALLWATTDIEIRLPAIEKALDYLIAGSCPAEVPSIGDALECWRMNTAPEDQIRCWLLMRGADPDVWTPVLDSRSETLRGMEIIQWGRRANVPQPQIVNALRARGWRRPADLQGLLTLYDRLPSVGETLNWFTHNVDDLADVLRSGKFSGFDTVDNCLARWKQLVDDAGIPAPFSDGDAKALIQQWADYMHQVGQDPTFVPRFAKDLADQGVADKVMTQNYLANWQLPPVTQLYEMAFRLRPGRVDKSLEFTDAQLKRYLAEWKFSPFWLDRLFAIARPAPNLTMVTQAFEVGALDAQGYIGRLQDLGFSLPDAELLAKARMVVATRRLTSAAHGWTPAALSAAYGAQTINDKLVDDEMNRQGWDQASIQRLKDRALTDVRTQVVVRSRRRAVQTATAQVIASYKAGTITRQDAIPIMVGMGFNADTAGAVFDATDASVYTGVVSKAIAALRRAFLHGELSLQQVQDQMVSIGITPERQQSYLQTWQVEFTAPRKALSTTKIVQLVTEGLLDVPTATQRLLNLGWQQPDILLQLAEAQQKISARSAKAALASQRSAKAAAAAIAKAQKQATAQARQLQGDLRRIMPVARLKKWLLSGQVTEQFVIDRMLASGYTPQSIALYISEWVGKPAPGSEEYQKLIDKAQARMKGRFPLAELRKAFKAGAIDRTYIVQRLLQEGYSPQLAEILAGDVTGDVTTQITAATAEVPPQ